MVSNLGTTGGSISINQGRLFVELTPRSERPAVEHVIQDLRRQANQFPGLRVFMQPIQNIISAPARPAPNTSTPCRGCGWTSSTNGHRGLRNGCRGCRSCRM
ncbi:hypothetical protein ACFQU2_31750 [Siccirubricoccus deserti]